MNSHREIPHAREFELPPKDGLLKAPLYPIFPEVDPDLSNWGVVGLKVLHEVIDPTILEGI
jgi:hypothetical protein